ncbi:MAG: DUF3592 domain-containing protein [Gammaproteobacteria bacterium]
MRILNTLFVLILGAAFAYGGARIAMETAIPTFQSWQAMKSWKAASATLLSVAGSENSTEASYRYTASGVEYRNDRVYLASFKDNIGSYHQDLYQHLLRLQRNHQPVTIWYNPENPNQSVIDRDMRWGLFALMAAFCSVFILIGLTLGYASLRTCGGTRSDLKKPSLAELRRQWRQKQADSNYRESFFAFVEQQAEELKKQPPNTGMAVVQNSADLKPWLNKKAWQTHRIRSNAKTSLYATWAFAILWSGISSPVLFVLGDEIRQENYAVLIALLFPLVGLVLLIMAWNKTRAWRRFGIIELEMDPFPGSIGGHVGGSLQVDKPSDSHTRYKIELECVYSYESGSGEDRSRQESVKWAEAGFAKTESTGQGVRLKFRFDVPEDLPEADIEQKDAYHFWRLKVSSNGETLALNREYIIPVFKTHAQSKFIRHDNSAEAEERRKELAEASQAAIDRGDFASTPLSQVFRYKNMGSKQIFYYPMFRNKVLTLVALIFAGGFDFAAIAINQNFGGDGIIGIVMFIFSLPFALVGLLASIASIYLPFNNLTVTLAGRKITALRRLLFIPIKYDQIRCDELRNIEVKSNGSTGQGVKQIKHHKLIAQTKNLKKVTVAEDIDGEELAHQLKGFIGSRLGLTL